MIAAHSSLELEQAKIEVDHLAALSLEVKLLQVDLALVGVAVSHVGHAHHVVFFAVDTDLTGATIHVFLAELLSLELSTVGEDLYDFLRDHVSYKHTHRNAHETSINHRND